MKAHYLTIAGRPVKSWMVTSLLALAAVGYVVFVFLPGQRSIAQIRSEIDEKRQHVLQSQQLGAPIRQAELRLASTREFTADWRANAPRPRDLVGVYAQLAEQAKAAGVRVKRLDPQQAVQHQVLGEHPLVVSLEGPFASVFDFVRRVEQMPETIWIRDLRLARSEGGSETLTVEMTLTIFTDRSEIAD
jgi:Tfp pilus assembly protein PilO